MSQIRTAFLDTIKRSLCLGNSAPALTCELLHHPHPRSRADLLISVQSVHESSSEDCGAVRPPCPSLLPVPAMNMELFCGWELAYVFCLISRPHSHFKGRSTRGLDFLICLATESTTCMWDQLPARADNPFASKYTSSPPFFRPACFIALHCAPSFREAARSPSGPNWVWSCFPISSCSDWVRGLRCSAWQREGSRDGHSVISLPKSSHGFSETTQKQQRPEHPPEDL